MHYCDMTTVPQLRIVIQNQGQGNAPASMTRVKFSPGGIMDIPTPASAICPAYDARSNSHSPSLF